MNFDYAISDLLVAAQDIWKSNDITFLERAGARFQDTKQNLEEAIREIIREEIARAYNE